MSADLLVPATEALLRDWCGPVVHALGRFPTVVDGRDYAMDGATRCLYSLGVHGRAAPEDLLLDLARDEAADRCLRVLAEARGRKADEGVTWARWHLGWVLAGARAARLNPKPHEASLLFVPAEAAARLRFGFEVVPGLGDLPAAHPHLDRLALARVVRHCLVETR